jgi:hypothetical protein
MTLDSFRSHVEALPQYSAHSRWVINNETYNKIKRAAHLGSVRWDRRHKQKRTHNGRLTKHRRGKTNEQD